MALAPSLLCPRGKALHFPLLCLSTVQTYCKHGNIHELTLAMVLCLLCEVQTRSKVHGLQSIINPFFNAHLKIQGGKGTVVRAEEG